MNLRNVRSPIGGMLLLVALAFCCSGTPAQAALTPQSPEVREAVKKGTQYLATYRYWRTLGRRALAATALVKAGEPKDHPFVQQALTQLKAHYEKPPKLDYESVYETAVCIIFLCALDPVEYRNEISALTQFLLSMQRPFGPFSNPTEPIAMYGDTSMTQYAILAFWEAEKAGVSIPKERWQLLTNWLLKTQVGNGGFCYTPDRHDVPPEVTYSMTAGGLGSCYIIAALSGITKAPVKRVDPSLPSALQPVAEKPQAVGSNRLGVNAQGLQSAINRGDAWFANNYKIDVKSRQHYFLYSFERYSSFREFVEQQANPNPAWYDEGAQLLLSTQGNEGHWGQPEDTAFAILFLVRSTKQGLNQQDGDLEGQGILIGGRGLPLDAKELEIRGGSIVVKPLAGPADQLLKVLGDPNDERFSQAVAGLEQYVERADDKQLSPFLVRLRQMANSDSPAARAAAIRGLAKARNLDDVPFIIHALEDEDHRVTEAARDALQLLSRRFDGFGPKLPATPAEKQAAANKWRQWYLSLKPAAEFDP